MRSASRFLTAVLAMVLVTVTLSACGDNSSDDQQKLTVAQERVMDSATAVCTVRGQGSKLKRNSLLKTLIQYYDTYGQVSSYVAQKSIKPIAVVNAAASICSDAEKIITTWQTKNTQSEKLASNTQK